MTDFIPVFRPPSYSSRRFLKRVNRILRSQVLANGGPQSDELKQRIASRFGVEPERIVLVSSATLGLEGLVAVLSEACWRIPTWSFPATALAPIRSGASVVFGRFNFDELILGFSDTEASHSVVTLPPGTGIPEHWQSSEIWPAIVDAAAGFGSLSAISLAKMPKSSNVVLSLHGTKYLGSGEGGVVLCGSTEVADELRRWANFGLNHDRMSEVVGTNAKLSEIGAAFASHIIDQEPKIRQQILRLRRETREIQESHGLGVRVFDNYPLSPYWIVNYGSADRKRQVENNLNSRGIETRDWWNGLLPYHPAFLNIPIEDPQLPEFGIISSLGGLPFGPHLSVKSLRKISRVMSESLQNYSGREGQN